MVRAAVGRTEVPTPEARAERDARITVLEGHLEVADRDARLSVIETQISGLRELLALQIESQRQNLEAQIGVARTIAEQAKTKAEGAAEKQALDASVESLRTSLLDHIRYQKQAIDLALEGQKLSEQKTDAAMEKRFESVNEWRASLSDLSTRFLLKDEAGFRLGNLDEKIAAITKDITINRGRGAGLNAAWVYVLGTIAAVGTLVSVIVLLSK